MGTMTHCPSAQHRRNMSASPRRRGGYMVNVYIQGSCVHHGIDYDAITAKIWLEYFITLHPSAEVVADGKSFAVII